MVEDASEAMMRKVPQVLVFNVAPARRPPYASMPRPVPSSWAEQARWTPSVPPSCGHRYVGVSSSVPVNGNNPRRRSATERASDMAHPCPCGRSTPRIPNPCCANTGESQQPKGITEGSGEN